MPTLLKLGSHGDDVSELQRRLSRKGYPCVVDGIFGPLTEGQVKAFQKANGLQVDGIVGPKTRGVLGWPFDFVEEDTDPAPDALVVDVSQFGGIPDYDALREKGVVGCIPRLGTGIASVDKLAAEQIKRARAAGLEVSAGYFYVQSARDGAAQALHAQALEEKFGIPVFVDVEPVKPKNGEWPVPTDAPHLYRQVAIDCLARVPRVYGGLFLEAMGLPEWVGDCVFWNAAYPAKEPPPGAPPPRLPKPMRRAALWQYRGNVPVLPAGVVVDFNRVFGGLAALTAALKA